MLVSATKWAVLGSVAGAAISLFVYQKAIPRFESHAVVSITEFEQRDQDGSEPTRFEAEDFFFRPEIISPAIRMVSQGSAGYERRGVGVLAPDDVSLFLKTNAFRVFQLPFEDGKTTLRISYVGDLPSEARRFITALIETSQNLLVSSSTPEQHSSNVEKLVTLKTHSEQRIQRIKAELLDLPIDQEGRWTDDGIESHSTLEWDSLQQEAGRLHRRKAIISERLVALVAQQPQGIQEAQDFESPENLAEEDRLEEMRIKNPRNRVLDEIDYLQRQQELIQDQHQQISSRMRVLARTIDLEEQIAFEEYALRRELIQELEIRDQLLKLLNGQQPRETVAYEPNVSVTLLEGPSEPIQIEPKFSTYLFSGTMIGATLVMSISLFVVAAGFEGRD